MTNNITTETSSTALEADPLMLIHRALKPLMPQLYDQVTRIDIDRTERMITITLTNGATDTILFND